MRESEAFFLTNVASLIFQAWALCLSGCPIIVFIQISCQYSSLINNNIIINTFIFITVPSNQCSSRIPRVAGSMSWWFSSLARSLWERLDNIFISSATVVVIIGNIWKIFYLLLHNIILKLNWFGAIVLNGSEGINNDKNLWQKLKWMTVPVMKILIFLKYWTKSGEHGFVVIVDLEINHICPQSEG